MIIDITKPSLSSFGDHWYVYEVRASHLFEPFVPDGIVDVHRSDMQGTHVIYIYSMLKLGIGKSIHFRFEARYVRCRSLTPYRNLSFRYKFSAHPLQSPLV